MKMPMAGVTSAVPSRDMFFNNKLLKSYLLCVIVLAEGKNKYNPVYIRLHQKKLCTWLPQVKLSMLWFTSVSQDGTNSTAAYVGISSVSVFRKNSTTITEKLKLWTLENK